MKSARVHIMWRSPKLFSHKPLKPGHIQIEHVQYVSGATEPIVHAGIDHCSCGVLHQRRISFLSVSLNRLTFCSLAYNHILFMPSFALFIDPHLRTSEAFSELPWTDVLSIHVFSTRSLANRPFHVLWKLFLDSFHFFQTPKLRSFLSLATCGANLREEGTLPDPNLIVHFNPPPLKTTAANRRCDGYYLLSGNIVKHCDGIITKQLTHCKKFIISVLKQNCTLKESPPQLRAAD